jgi:DUF4097 and DUF4098 domain-containing protein YvlB
MKKWTIVGILAISLFAICLGSVVAFLPVINQAWTGNFQWNLVSGRNNSVEAVEEFRAPVDGPAELSIHTPFGKVDVTAVAGSREILISARKTAWGVTKQAAEDLLQKAKITIQQDGNTVEVKVEEPVQIDLIHIGPAGVGVDFTVSVPVDCAVEASSASGDIHLAGTTGDAALTTSFGAVKVESVRGRLSAGSSAGDVTVTGVAAPNSAVKATSSFGEVSVSNTTGGDLIMESSSGEVRVEDSAFSGSATITTSFGDLIATGLEAASLTARTNSGKVTLQGLKIAGALSARSDFGDVAVKQSAAAGYDLDTNSGKITAAGTSGSVKARSGFGDLIISGDAVVLDLTTGSGSIEFNGSLADGESSLHTDFGDIRVRLPAEAGFQADLSTNFGNVSCSFPITATVHDSTHVSGTVGGGGPTLKASTNSGNVTVSALSAD